MELFIPDNVWQASVQAAVDNWFAEHPPAPTQPPGPGDVLNMAVTTPADYTAAVRPLWNGPGTGWWFGRGAGDDWTDPAGGAWESQQQAPEVTVGELHNLRTDRLVTVYVRDDQGLRAEMGVQATGPLRPEPPSPGSVLGARGLFAYDQTLGVTKQLQATLGIPDPTASNPLLCVLHLDHSGDWGGLGNVWFASGWRDAGAEYRLVVTVPPWPSPLGNQYDAAARGDFDGNWRTVLTNISNAFSSGTVNEEIWLRFAHEANCCYVWQASNNVSEYKTMWRRWSGIARSVSPRFKLIYCPFYGAAKVGFDSLAPDPADYDRTGMDYYGYKNWRESETIKYGTEWYGAWTKTVGKPGGFYESNPATYPQVPVQDMPDDPAWMDSIFGVCQRYGLDFVSYNDSNADVRSYLPDFPQNLERYKTTFAAG